MTEKIHSRKIKVDGREIHYYTAGQGEPVLVIHGGGGDARSWLKNVAVLAEKYTVYAPDLPGFGESQPLEGSYYVPELTDFVESFARSLGLEKFHLMGHSIGGGVALNYALRFPQKIKKLVLISSLCLGREIALWVRIMTLPARYADKALLVLTGGLIWVLKKLLTPLKVVVPLYLASVNFGRSIADFREQTLVLANHLSELLIPTLVVWGGRDPIVPVQHAYAAAEVIPDCQLKVFKNRGHNVHRDEIQQFSDILHRFLG